VWVVYSIFHPSLEPKDFHVKLQWHQIGHPWKTTGSLPNPNCRLPVKPVDAPYRCSDERLGQQLTTHCVPSPWHVLRLHDTNAWRVQTLAPPRRHAQLTSGKRPAHDLQLPNTTTGGQIAFWEKSEYWDLKIDQINSVRSRKNDN
jgi:hypothetical protein